MSSSPPPPCGANDLPLELINYIISFLHGYPASLKACSLVCRSWSGDSSTRLFAEFSPREAADLRDVVRVVQTSERIQAHATSLFVGHRCDKRPEETMTVDLEDLFDLMASLPKLDKLVMSWANVALSGDLSAEVPALGHKFNLEFVNLLDVRQLTNSRSREFFAFWTAFSSGVRAVVLEDYSEVSHPPVRDVAPANLKQLPGPIPIRNLHIGVPASHFQAWVPRLFNLEGLLSLQLIVHNPRPILPFLRNVVRIGKNLQRVSTYIEFTCMSVLRDNDIRTYGHVTSSMRLPDFSEHCDLRCFSFEGLTPFPEITCTPGAEGEAAVTRLTDREQSGWDAVMDMLGTLAATRVLLLHILGTKTTIVKQGTLRDYLWDQLGRKLDGLPNLRHIFLLTDVGIFDPSTCVGRNPWFDDRETMNQIHDAFPARLQKMLNFGAFGFCEVGTNNVVYMPPGATENVTTHVDRLHALAYAS